MYHFYLLQNSVRYKIILGGGGVQGQGKSSGKWIWKVHLVSKLTKKIPPVFEQIFDNVLDLF